jgi:hypothetical protein
MYYMEITSPYWGPQAPDRDVVWRKIRKPYEKMPLGFKGKFRKRGNELIGALTKKPRTFWYEDKEPEWRKSYLAKYRLKHQQIPSNPPTSNASNSEAVQDSNNVSPDPVPSSAEHQVEMDTSSVPVEQATPAEIQSIELEPLPPSGIVASQNSDTISTTAAPVSQAGETPNIDVIELTTLQEAVVPSVPGQPDNTSVTPQPESTTVTPEPSASGRPDTTQQSNSTSVESNTVSPARRPESWPNSLMPKKAAESSSFSLVKLGFMELRTCVSMDYLDYSRVELQAGSIIK